MASKVPTANPRPSILWEASTVISGLFLGLARLLIRMLGVLGRPFSASYLNQPTTLRLEGDLKWISERQRVRFTALFALLVVLILAGGLIYADAMQIPISRLLFAMAATCVFWALLVIYISYLFRPLGKPSASVFAYVASFLFALLFYIWLINLRAIDQLLSFIE